MLKAHGYSLFYPQTIAVQAGTTIIFYEEAETLGAILEGDLLVSVQVL